MADWKELIKYFVDTLNQTQNNKDQPLLKIGFGKAPWEFTSQKFRDRKLPFDFSNWKNKYS